MSNRNTHNKAVIVLGMHRSGTSALTRGLKAIGVELGDELIGADLKINPKGYWEDREINNFNEQLLESLGLTWHSLSMIAEERLDAPAVQQMQLPALELLKRKFENVSLWGFKDPRVARLIQFWQTILTKMGVEDTYVIVCRNPISVEKSLGKRDGFDPRKSHLLWLLHMVQAISRTHGKQRVVVDFDELITSPVEQLSRMADRLDIRLDSAAEESICEYSNSFLAHDLRHYHYSVGDLISDENVPRLTIEVYEWLQRLAKDQLSCDDPFFLTEWIRIEKAFSGLLPIINLVDTIDKKNQSLQIQTKELDALNNSHQDQLKELQQQLENVSNQTQELQALISVRDDQLASLRHNTSVNTPTIQNRNGENNRNGERDVSLEFNPRLIAFYLPQYHPIPENDRWWGKGFTEWHNVVKAQPLFPGHYQPHLPAELGYYDLRVPEVREEQAILARAHGIHGFCYYYYWFNGKRLLERPLLDMFHSGTPDFPYCLCWANENWTRRWDGGSSEILMEQLHSIENDRDFIRSVFPFFEDKRYIRVDGKPLFLVYRSDILPAPKQTTEIWRNEAYKAGIGEIYLVRVESFYSCDPVEMGFDAACEFPPHLIGSQYGSSAIQQISYLDSTRMVMSYEQAATEALRRPVPSYKQFKGIMPSWDNTARRGDNAHLFINASPEKYQEWLVQLIKYTQLNFAGDERMIFVNAWNEWAEGCHLEPDLAYGRAYLEATKAALAQTDCFAQSVSANEAPVSGEHPEQTRFLSRQFSTASKDALPYRNWLIKHELSEVDACHLKHCLENQWANHPTIHLLLHVEPHQQMLLADTIDAIGAQIYQNWRLTIVAPYPSPDPIFDELEVLNWITLEEGSSVEQAINHAAIHTPADWVAIIQPGDRFQPHLLAVSTGYINTHPTWKFIYTDEDSINNGGEHFDPLFKPDFNLDLLRSQLYIGHFCLIKREALKKLDGIELIEAANEDIVLRVLDHYGEEVIGHIPSVLFHHYVDNHNAAGQQQIEQTKLRLLQNHFKRNDITAKINPGLIPGSFFVDYPLTRTPRVSIIIPTCDRLDLIKPCILSLLEKTSYTNYEVLIVDNNSKDPEVLTFFDELSNQHNSVKIIRYPHPYNFSAINNAAAREASGEFLLLLNNDTVILQANWLERMLANGLRSEVGVVGPRLVFPDKTVQHAGVILGMGALGVAEHVHISLSMNEPGYMGRAQVAQNFAAVTGACLLIRKDLYTQVGGLDEQRFEVLFNDIDLCLKVGELGYKVVWTPHVTVLHHGSSSLSQNPDPSRAERNQQAVSNMLEDWLPQLAHDPAFNRNLSLVKRNPVLEDATDVTWDSNLETRLRVLALPCNSGGTGEYRVRAPLRALECAGSVAHSLLGNHDGQSVRVPSITELMRANPDVFLLQNAFEQGFVEALKRYKPMFARVTRIFGLDDLVFDVPQTNSFRRLGPKQVKKTLRQMLSLCDRAIVATHPIAEALHGMIGDIRVVPNYLEKARWGELTSLRRQGRKPRVGWAGGSQHQADLELLLPVVKETAADVDWVLMGMCPESMHPYVTELHPGVAFEDFPVKLASLNLDLAVAPLEHHRFNAAKSNLRLLEYGILALPVVCTDILPYQKAPVKRVPNNPRAWINAIRERAYDLDAAYAEGDQLKQWVLDHWMLEEHLTDWSHALQPL